MPATTILAYTVIDGHPVALNRADLDALHAYARHEQIHDIALRLGETQERTGMRLAHLCGLNRGRARELYRQATTGQVLA